MLRILCVMLACVSAGWLAGTPALGDQISWYGDYATAMRAAEQQGKMLVILFCPAGDQPFCDEFAERTVAAPKMLERLRNAICVILPLNAKITVKGKQEPVLNSPAYAGLGGRPGLAIVDLANKENPNRFGRVAGTFPLGKGSPHPTDKIGAVLDWRPVKLNWHVSYAEATDTAQRQQKMLLIYFCAPRDNPVSKALESEALADAQVAEKLSRYVLLKLPVDAKIEAQGGKIELLKHGAFAEMLGQPGIAVIDFAHKGAGYYGDVVSAFPFLDNAPYTTEQMGVILDLPPGTLTQRTLIYAVRVHPERPASTQGRLDNSLAREAESHAEYQARIRLQGHHFWENRFHRINALLPGGLTAKEVCAESWPGQRLLQAAIECVRCWRLSSGHWGAVVAPHPYYGYDMKLGDNGIWYATGIFGGN